MLLEQAVWLAASVLLSVPVGLLGLLVGVLAWRGSRPLRGVVAALATQVAAWTAAWPALVEVVSFALILAVLSAPLMGAAWLLSRRVGVVSRAPLGGLLGLTVMVPALLVALVVLSGGAWHLVAIAFLGLTSGIVLSVRERATLPGLAVVHVALAFAVALWMGFLDGTGIGGLLQRSVPTGEIRAAFDASLALVSGVAVAVMLAPPRQVQGLSAAEPHPPRHTVEPAE